MMRRTLAAALAVASLSISCSEKVAGGSGAGNPGDAVASVAMMITDSAASLGRAAKLDTIVDADGGDVIVSRATARLQSLYLEGGPSGLLSLSAAPVTFDALSGADGLAGLPMEAGTYRFLRARIGSDESTEPDIELAGTWATDSGTLPFLFRLHYDPTGPGMKFGVAENGDDDDSISTGDSAHIVIPLKAGTMLRTLTINDHLVGLFEETGIRDSIIVDPVRFSGSTTAQINREIRQVLINSGEQVTITHRR